MPVGFPAIEKSSFERSKWRFVGARLMPRALAISVAPSRWVFGSRPMAEFIETAGLVGHPPGFCLGDALKLALSASVEFDAQMAKMSEGIAKKIQGKKAAAGLKANQKKTESKRSA
jgi:hypothetical protein